MKYRQKAFSVPLTGSAYAKGWERVFVRRPVACVVCGAPAPGASGEYPMCPECAPPPAWRPTKK